MIKCILLLKIVLSLVLFFFGSKLFASEKSLSELASSKAWLKLLHYENFDKNEKGVVHSADFYLSLEGRSNPLAELQATLDAMAIPESHLNEHVRCRFPARVKWLEKKLDLISKFDTSKYCPDYYAWIGKTPPSSISVVLATGYLANPASFYGHTFLKFNSDLSPNRDNDLLDNAVNYGAIGAGSDNPVTYILKSLFGGYDAGFSHIDFYFHNHNYGENELRDLWEYELNLPQSDVAFIYDHVWELLGKRYTYYFFKYNCAFRMSEIIEIIDSITILSRNSPWTIPQVITRNLKQAGKDGESIVKRVIYHPSRQSRFHSKYQNLNSIETEIFKEIIRDRLQFDSTEFVSLNIDSRKKILETVMDYYQFLNPKSLSTENTPKKYTQALNTRFGLPINTVEAKLDTPISPHEGRPASWLQLGYAYSQKTQNQGLLRIRPAYYDQLDSGIGHVNYSALSMGDTQVYFDEGKIYLKKLDLLSIEAVQPAISGLSGDAGFAWKLRVGAAQAKSGCYDCLLTRIQTDIGMGRRLSHNVFLAGYVGAGFGDKGHDLGYGYARASLDLIIHFNQSIGLKSSFERRENFLANISSQNIYKSEVRAAIGQKSDIRLTYEKADIPSSTIGIGLYW